VLDRNYDDKCDDKGDDKGGIQYACEVMTWVAINDGKYDKDMRAKLDKKVAASTRYPPF
jgi:hypothetical protein